MKFTLTIQTENEDLFKQISVVSIAFIASIDKSILDSEAQIIQDDEALRSTLLTGKEFTVFGSNKL